VTGTPASTATPTVTATPTPTPTPTCQITGDGILEFDNYKVRWDITNTGSDTTLVRIDINWPSWNHELERINFGLSSNMI
jgi:hypothetical protein